LITHLDERSLDSPAFSYIIRYKPDRDSSASLGKTRMAGFGVELALKKTDYLVVDDRATGSSSSAEEVDGSVGEVAAGTFEEILGEDPWAELATPLSKFEVMGEHNPGPRANEAYSQIWDLKHLRSSCHLPTPWTPCKSFRRTSQSTRQPCHVKCRYL
jgi:hypothetical protein